MFVSIRDIFFAKGRVALVATVVGLITVLLVMLTGLTNGLGKQNTSALELFDAQRVVLSAQGTAEQNPTFTTSRVDRAQLHEWRSASGVSHAEPLVVAQTQLDAGETAASAAVMGLPHDSHFTRELIAESGDPSPHEGEAVISRSLAEDLNVGVGDTVSTSGSELRVAGVTEDEYYSHTPVAWTVDSDALTAAHQPEGTVATAVLVDFSSGLSGSGADDRARVTDRAAGTHSSDTPGAFASLPAYSSEHGSLVSMQGFLYVISALVTVSFITVWTVQRTRDIAVLRALGASRGYLFKDALAQAAIVVTLGALAGLLVGAGGGYLLSTFVSAVPFHVSAASVLVPAAGVVVLGITGSLLAVRRVTSIDPMIALGGN